LNDRTIIIRAQEEQRRLILKQVLTTEASERLANVSLVKPDKARQVENYLIKSAQGGQLGGKVSEDQLKDLLSQVTAQTQQKTKVTISRRRHNFDDDNDDDDEGW
jgi:programmed cell death protein 5